MPSSTSSSGSSRYYSAILSPVKMVLPGIIVSLVGGAAGFFIFNNPTKIKAKATYATWNIIGDYEKMFTKYVEDAYCIEDSLDQLKFRKDYSHQLSIIIQNLNDLKGEDNVDTRLNSVLNVKIARYTESKALTEEYIDSAVFYNSMVIQGKASPALLKKTTTLQEDYIKNLAHIETRDTTMLKDVAGQLTESYKKFTAPFLTEIKVLQPAEEMKKYITGSWRMPEIGVLITFNADSTAVWKNATDELSFKWSFDSARLVMTNKTEQLNFYIFRISEKTIYMLWKEMNNAIISGCRK
jgi:hypothetical protein